ncbi:MAG TPA: class I SAM-dependent methyltransferase [Ktedonobacteraceae bacterium]|nr:class I SAM-dependent methyltransferase [Ktedonobacteraceae bacterium]
MIEHQALARLQDHLEFEHVLIDEMGELLPGKLLEECDLTHAQSMLEIGCGGGEWLRAVARQYPDLQCIGIDQDEHLVKAANALSYRDGLSQVAFLAMDMSELSPALFPETSFDLVQLSFLGRYILTADYPGLARTCAALCRPGGVVCWIEAELPLTTSVAFERLVALVCEALQRAGQSFISESMWEWTELVATRSGKPGVDRSSYQRRHLGITPMLGSFQRDAGCGAQRERPIFSIWGIDERVIHQTAYVLEVSAGQPAHEGFVALARRFAHQVKQFLLRSGVIEELEHTTLCHQLDTELASQEFCGLSFLLRAWAPRP